MLASVDYEGSTPVQAFMAEMDAKEFVARCEAHFRKKPKAPEKIEETPENDAEHETFWEKHQRWAKRHPAGSIHASCDSFEVMFITLNAKKN